MTEYSITLARSPGVSDAELRRRLAAAYHIIRKAAHRAQRKAAEGEPKQEGQADHHQRHTLLGGDR